jgi:hypothetical protein
LKPFAASKLPKMPPDLCLDDVPEYGHEMQTSHVLQLAYRDLLIEDIGYKFTGLRGLRSCQAHNEGRIACSWPLPISASFSESNQIPESLPRFPRGM